MLHISKSSQWKSFFVLFQVYYKYMLYFCLWSFYYFPYLISRIWIYYYCFLELMHLLLVKFGSVLLRAHNTTRPFLCQLIADDQNFSADCGSLKHNGLLSGVAIANMDDNLCNILAFYFILKSYREGELTYLKEGRTRVVMAQLLNIPPS